MTDEKEVLRIYRSHKKWYSSVREEHEMHRKFYSDDAWNAKSSKSALMVTGEGVTQSRPEARITKTQVNLVRPWVTSFIASLYYRGVKFSVTPDERVGKLDKKERNQVAGAIAAELNRVFDIEDTEDAAERGFTMGLLYRGGLAFKVGVDADNELVKNKPEDRLWIEALPPYECVWDRKTRNKRKPKYMGHLYVMSKQVAMDEFGVSDDVATIALTDVIEHGFETNVPEEEQDDTYVRILELTCFEDVFSKGDAKAQGEFSVWLIEDGDRQEKLTELKRTATPYNTPVGGPLCNMVPFISEPDAVHPLDSYAPAKSIVELNTEYNVASSMLAEAFRRDANRIILYLKNKGLSEEEIAQIVRGEDLEMVGIDAPTLEGLFKHMELPPVSNTLLDYLKHLQDAVDRTQLIADFARGKAGEYLSATEAANLANYTETTIGRIRKRMDATLARVAALYLRALRSELKGKLEVDVDGETVAIESKHLDLRWKIQVVDTASTPAAAAQKMADLVSVQKNLLELALNMQEGGIVGKMSEELLALMVALMDLPPALLPSALKEAAAPPEEEAPPPQNALPPEAAIPPPAEPGSIAGGQVGQAVMDQAEAEMV